MFASLMKRANKMTKYSIMLKDLLIKNGIRPNGYDDLQPIINSIKYFNDLERREELFFKLVLIFSLNEGELTQGDHLMHLVHITKAIDFLDLQKDQNEYIEAFYNKEKSSYQFLSVIQDLECTETNKIIELLSAPDMVEQKKFISNFNIADIKKYPDLDQTNETDKQVKLATELLFKVLGLDLITNPKTSMQEANAENVSKESQNLDLMNK